MNQKRVAIFLGPYLSLWLAACGSLSGTSSDTNKEQINPQQKTESENHNARNDVRTEREFFPRVALTDVKTEGTSIDTLALIDYQNADFVQTLRCSANFILRSPLGFDARDASGKIIPLSSPEKIAVWSSALADTTHCRLLGEKVMRTSFSDPFAASGKYYYIFNPCRASDASARSVSCSFELSSTNNITVTSSIGAEKLRLLSLLMTKEAQLASITLRFRSKLMIALEAQQRCEGNAAVDAVKEARSKALASLLGASVAAAIGGVIAGPSSAVLLAKQALHWISEYYGPGTQTNPSKCHILKDAEAEARDAGTEIEIVRKEIGQIQEELANL